MRVLALDTTTRGGSVALIADDRIVLERGGDPSRTHAERLPGEILSLLDEAGVALPDVDVFAIASGPGSFTGLRVGIATLQGMALVNRRRIVPVSALEVLGAIGSSDLRAGAVIAAWMDAYRRDVFSALYTVGDGPPFGPARLVEIDPPAVGDPTATLSRWSARHPPPDVFIGDGAVLYAAAVGERGRIVSPPALAGALGRIAAERARAGQDVDPAGVQPLYVRRPDAELARENAPPRRTQGTPS